ncbi:membrane lipoprotein [Francisella opportunistica]|uniref:Membrane lipoprotein n=1 Tax=Francisella opportunistica TaxID=2016517 RepID=A0A345JTT3_9GAMM|nr:membrane lipoprotein [Francisella opportunistica]AXH32375.1 membrane lipoprotein [Francisella opportunistica]AXH34022.1 membrane lipoprotein [Francisella opportunistica]
MNKTFVGFMAGLISACILYFIFTLIRQHSIELNDQFKYTLYRLMVWGGVWAILFALPLPKNIFIKSSIIALAVILFNFLVKMPLAGQGFFAANAGAEVFIMNIVFNYPWGILAGLIYKVVSLK